MWWFLAFLVVVLLIARYSGFRRVVGWSTAALAGAGACYGVYYWAEAELAKGRISSTEVEFLGPLKLDMTGNLNGRLKNNSHSRILSGFVVEVKIKDCSPPNGDPGLRIRALMSDPRYWGLTPVEQLKIIHRLDPGLKHTLTEKTLPEFEATVDPPQSFLDGCEIVGQDSTLVSVEVPPGQARDFQTHVYFGSPEIRGVGNWAYRIAEVRGR